MKISSEFAYLTVFLLLAAFLNIVGGEGGSLAGVKASALLGSLMLLVILGLIWNDFSANLDWPHEKMSARIKNKGKELRHGRQHLLREIHKQLRVLKQAREKNHQYHDELLKDLAVLTRQLD